MQQQRVIGCQTDIGRVLQERQRSAFECGVLERAIAIEHKAIGGEQQGTASEHAGLHASPRSDHVDGIDPIGVSHDDRASLRPTG